MPDKKIELIKYCILPLLVYLVISQAVAFGGKQAAIHITEKEFRENNQKIEQEVFLEQANGWLEEHSSVFNLVNGICNLIVLYFVFYRKYNKRIEMEKIQRGLHKPGKWSYLFCVFTGAFTCLALNNWIVLSGISKKITTYEEVSKHIYSGNIIVMAFDVIFVAACMEELLFRGLLYRQLKEQLGVVVGGILSALFFGILHGNFVQGLYAFLIGIILVFSYEKYQTMAAPVLIHISANMISVVATETTLFSRYRNAIAFIVDTVIATLVVTICLIQMEIKVKPKVYGK